MDPWEQAAKEFKPSAGGAPAAPAEGGNDDWKLWQQRGSPETSARDQTPIGDRPVSMASFTEVPRIMGSQALEALKGAGKGALSTVYHAASPIRSAFGMEQPLNKPEVQQQITPTGTPQNIGYGLEHAAEYAIPAGLVGRGAKAVEGVTAGIKSAPVINALARSLMEGAGAGVVRGAQTGDPGEAVKTGLGVGAGSALIRGLPLVLPNAERAGNTIGNIREQLKDEPVNISGTAPSALRAQQLAKAKFTRPPVMREVLNRLSPGAEPTNFREATDLGMNAGKLSVAERASLKGPMGAQVKQLAKALSEANQDVAERAGLGDVYKKAMTEYSRAMKVQGVKDTAGELAKSTAAKYIAGATLGAGGYAAYQALK